MSFLHGIELHQRIKHILGQKRNRCAVAFWGRGAEDLVSGGNDSKIICNLISGGTNPEVIESLIKIQCDIRQIDDLHAKVYIGSDGAIVTSANASANGLALEGLEQNHWQEAGVFISNDTTREVETWFETQWNNSRKITDADLRLAKEIWASRHKPTIDFYDFDVRKTNLPLVTWIGETGYELDEKRVKEEIGTNINQVIRDQIDSGLEIEDPRDISILTHSTWVLCWFTKKNGSMKMSSKPFWKYLNGKLDRVCRHGDQLNDTMLGATKMPPLPFDIANKLFMQALQHTIDMDRYKVFRTMDYEGAWFEPKKDLFEPFWHDLKKFYLQMRKDQPTETRIGPRRT